MNLSNFPWQFAFVVFVLGFAFAFMVAHTRALKPTLGDTLIAMSYSSGIPMVLIIWLWWWAGS